MSVMNLFRLSLPGHSRHALHVCRATSTSARLAKVDVSAEGERMTTTVTKDQHTFPVDEPPQLGGKGSGPTPLSYFLGALIGCSQITLDTVAKEQQVNVGKVRWKAEGKFDLRGLRGSEETNARFQEINLLAEVDTTISQQQLDKLKDEVERRCIIASTLKDSSTTLAVEYKRVYNFKSSMGQWIEDH